jgi:3-deoxy-D-manno-octulosonic-acid transferase
LRSLGAADFEVVVVDSVGELASLYRLAELVFAGGTLAHVGGHNLLEPVQAGRVVVHGPHTENQRTQQALLAPLGVLSRVENAAELARALHALWADPDRNAPASEAAKRLDEHRGATDRVLELVLAARR